MIALTLNSTLTVREVVAKFQEQGFRLVGRVINGEPCFVIKPLPTTKE